MGRWRRELMALEQYAHRLSTAEYDRMVDSGALDGLRVELLDGLLVDMSPQGERHAMVIQRVMQLCLAHSDVLRVQMPLAVAEGWTPEPDIALAERPDPDHHPTTAMLVVEVAVSSQAIDRRKAAVYARAGVPRYWLVDLPARTVIEHREPGSDGYAVVAPLSGDATLDAGVPGVETTSVAALFAV